LLDDDTPDSILARMHSFIGAEVDNYMGDRIRPLEGFIARPVAGRVGDGDDEQPLLDVSYEEENDQELRVDDIIHNSTVWKPTGTKSLKILTTAVAEKIVAITGTEIHPEPNQNQASLINGNFKLAREKLERLEPLLALQFRQRQWESPKASRDVLVMTDATCRLLGLEHVSNEGSPAYHRILVSRDQAQHLAKKIVCEGRIQINEKKWCHPNLDPNNLDDTGGTAFFSLWDDYRIKEVGTRPEFRPPTPIAAKQSTMPPPDSRFLNTSGQRAVAGWAKNIDITVDPESLPAEEPVEMTSRIRRRVAVDSDDSENDVDADEEPEPPGETFGSVQPKFARGDRPFESATGSSVMKPPIDIPRTPSPVEGAVKFKLKHDSDGEDEESPVQTNRLMSRPIPPVSSIPVYNAERSEWAPASVNGKQPEHVTRFPSTHTSNSNIAHESLEFPFNISNTSLSWLRPKTSETEQSDLGCKRANTNSSSEAAQRQHNSSKAPSSEVPTGLMAPLIPQIRHSNVAATNASCKSSDRTGGTHPATSNLDSRGSRPTPPVDYQMSKNYVNHRPKTGPDVHALREARIREAQQLAEKKAQQPEEENDGDTWSTISRAGRGRGRGRGCGGQRTRGRGSSQPRYHSTMSQKAPNPGKKKNKKGGDTGASGKTRQQLIDEQLGAPTPQPASSKSNRNDLSEMSTFKKKLLNKNNTMRAYNQDAIGLDLRAKEAQSLTEYLRPLFETTRTFVGELDFAIHFGQVLLSIDPHKVKGSKKFGPDQWQKVFNADSESLSSFTGLLTRNGADMDRVLEMTDAGMKVFDRSISGPMSVQFCFLCHSKDGDNFVLIVDESKEYRILNGPPAAIGMVCMQCPTQIWDACAMLQGADNQNDLPEDIAESIDAFVESLYIAEGSAVTLYYRQPPGNLVTVKAPHVKRVSQHPCLGDERKDFHLRITATTVLKVAPRHGDLLKAYEPDYRTLLQDQRVHFEMCLFDETMNNALKANKNLELGELTPTETTGKSLVRYERIQRLHDTAVMMLTKIDYLGRSNIGTMVFTDLVRRRQQEETSLLAGNLRLAQQPLQAMGRLRLATGIRPGESSAAYSEAPFSDVQSETPRAVPGTRMNTVAEPLRDEITGKYYRVGMGGARIPLGGTLSAQAGVIDTPLAPSDSASQMGGPAKKRPAVPTQPWSPRDDRGEGFW
jgi:hypothetical protein